MVSVIKNLSRLINKKAINRRTGRAALRTWRAIKSKIPNMPVPIMELEGETNSELKFLWFAHEHFELTITFINDEIDALFLDTLIDGYLHIEDLNPDYIEDEKGDFLNRLKEFVGEDTITH